MDILIKNNIVKQNKTIIDIGEFATKILDVHYAAREVEITNADIIDSHFFCKASEFDFAELAKKVDEVAKARKNVTVILPAVLTENKIISIKNKKESDIQKVIAKDYSAFGKVSNITHVIDYAYLGKHEEQGDSVHYCLLSAISKSLANELIGEFSIRNMKITTIIPAVYSQICLSELFFDDYEDLNRLFIDFGTNGIRITAFCEGIAVYTRTIDYGFNKYLKRLFTELKNIGKPEIKTALQKVGCIENFYDDCLKNIESKGYFDCVNNINNEIIAEISRVIDMCVNNDVVLSKLYYTGYIIPGFEEQINKETRLKCEKAEFKPFYEKDGKGYLLWCNNEYINGEFSNAVGGAIYPVI